MLPPEEAWHWLLPLQVVPPEQVPHDPPQPSSPQVLFVQLGVHDPVVLSDEYIWLASSFDVLSPPPTQNMPPPKFCAATQSILVLMTLASS